ncbi:MAG: hypothetical protein K9L26_01085 [Candidatus Izimaplasma sp.]|nr:hypothetical protein [Candidatus Izimaplasma bacterium]
MLQLVYKESFRPKYIILQSALFVFFLGLYVFLDFEGNISYQVMINEFGLFVTVAHFVLNIIIAIASAIMVSYSIIGFSFTKKEVSGSSAVPFLSFIFGLLTFGCTPCVVAFLSAVGIAFTPVILPNGNLPFKLMATAFVLIGMFWVLYTIKHTTCKIK